MDDYEEVGQTDVGGGGPDVMINGKCETVPPGKDKATGETVTFQTALKEVELVFLDGRHPFEEDPPFIVKRGGGTLTLTVRDDAAPKPKPKEEPQLVDYKYCPTDPEGTCPKCEGFPVITPPKMIIRGVS